MKKINLINKIVPVIYIVLGFLLALIPTVLLKPCASEEKKMACYYTGRAEVGLGLLIVFLGIAALFFVKANVSNGINIAQAGIAITALLFPLKITGLCKMDTMLCHVRTLPGIIVVSVLILAIAGANIVFTIFIENKIVVLSDKKNNAVSDEAA